jgi:hypothetical protein
MLPTIGRLAGTYAADFATPDPAWFGVFMALLLYAIVGAVMARALGTGEMKQALFAGIAAPAIVLSVLNGVSETNKTTAKTKNVATSQVTIGKLFPNIVVGHPASARPDFDNPQAAEPSNSFSRPVRPIDSSTFWGSFAWALGGSTIPTQADRPVP